MTVLVSGRRWRARHCVAARPDRGDRVGPPTEVFPSESDRVCGVASQSPYILESMALRSSRPLAIFRRSGSCLLS